MIKKKLTREQVINTLRKLELSWPEDLWIFVANGEVNLMERNTEGERATVETHYWGNKFDAVDLSKRLTSFPRIPADGGDW